MLLFDWVQGSILRPYERGAFNNWRGTGQWSWVWMFTKLSEFVLGANLSGRAESSHPHIRRPSVPDLNWNEGTLLLTFIHLMTWLPNQSFPVISLTKHNLTLESQYCASISHLAGLIVHSSELSEFSQSPVEVIIELLNCFDSLLSARNLSI